MGRVLVVIILVVLAVYAIFDVLAAPKNQVKHLPKWGWLILALLTPIGPMLWIIFGQAKPQTPRGPRRRKLGPDDDPDFLRGL